MADSGDRETLTIGTREVALSNPDKVLFPERGYTKRDLTRPNRQRLAIP